MRQALEIRVVWSVEYREFKPEFIAGLGAHHSLQLGAAICTTTCATLGFAGLFVEFAAAHFLLDTSMLNQFTESLDSIIDRLIFAQPQLYHEKTPSFCVCIGMALYG